MTIGETEAVMAEGYDVPGFGQVRVGTKVEMWGGEDGRSVSDWGEVTQLLPDRWVRVWWHMEQLHLDSEVEDITDHVVPEYSEEVLAMINRDRDLREGHSGAA